MASCQPGPEVWEFELKQAKIKDKFDRLKVVFKILTWLEFIREHKEVSKEFCFISDLNSLIVETKFTAEEFADLYADQKTAESDFRFKDISIRNLIRQAQSIALRSNIPDKQSIHDSLGKI